jgi:hypothetical protein
MTDSQLVCLSWCQVLSGAQDKIVVTIKQLQACWYGEHPTISSVLHAYPVVWMHVYWAISWQLTVPSGSIIPPFRHQVTMWLVPPSQNPASFLKMNLVISYLVRLQVFLRCPVDDSNRSCLHVFHGHNPDNSNDCIRSSMVLSARVAGPIQQLSV